MHEDLTFCDYYLCDLYVFLYKPKNKHVLEHAYMISVKKINKGFVCVPI